MYKIGCTRVLMTQKFEHLCLINAHCIHKTQVVKLAVLYGLLTNLFVIRIYFLLLLQYIL